MVGRIAFLSADWWRESREHMGVQAKFRFILLLWDLSAAEGSRGPLGNAC